MTYNDFIAEEEKRFKEFIIKNNFRTAGSSKFIYDSHQRLIKFIRDNCVPEERRGVFIRGEMDKSACVDMGFEQCRTKLLSNLDNLIRNEKGV